MRVAFYAPLKPPNHPVPSGDRRMARAFVRLLESLGHEVALVSRFRSYDRAGDPTRQQRLLVLGQRLAARLVRRFAAHPPDLWFTYHLYHKAPDHLGPAVATRLGIPYIAAEASLARRRAQGSWAVGYAASLHALERADLVLAMTSIDQQGLGSALPARRLMLFPPFLETSAHVAARSARDQHRARLATAHGLNPDRPWLLTVAMMRPDVKRESYRLLAEALRQAGSTPWHLLVAGDGDAKAEIASWLRPLGDRVRLLGPVAEPDLPPLYAACDLYVWPAVAEAYGMAMLEAQAAGLPVLAGREGGVSDIVADGTTGRLVPPRDAAAFAAALVDLLGQPELLRRWGDAASALVEARHAWPAARDRLAGAILRARTNHRERACVSA
jgi:glycosyltransferase involved in cell wall biosynthesis